MEVKGVLPRHDFFAKLSNRSQSCLTLVFIHVVCNGFFYPVQIRFGHLFFYLSLVGNF